MLKKIILSIAISSTILISNSYAEDFEMPSLPRVIQSSISIGENNASLVSSSSSSSYKKEEKKKTYHRCSCGHHLKNNNLQMLGVSDMSDVRNHVENTVVGISQVHIRR